MEEKIIREGAANWYHGFGSQGGKLILTNNTLYFEAHKLNVGKKETEIKLEDIEDVRTGFPNNLIVITNNGKEVFAVYKKKEWLSEINRVRKG